MTRPLHADLAKRYFLEDLPGATQLGARLNGILLKIDAGEHVTALQRQFLATTGLHALNALAEKGPAGYRVLARFQLAAAEAQAGNTDKAVALYDALATDGQGRHPGTRWIHDRDAAAAQDEVGRLIGRHGRAVSQRLACGRRPSRSARRVLAPRPGPMGGGARAHPR